MYDISQGIPLYGNLPSERQEKCIDCGKLAFEICKICGTLCRHCGAIHRHKKGSNDHITQGIGFDSMHRMKQESGFSGF